jgi:hypothetical protein
MRIRKSASETDLQPAQLAEKMIGKPFTSADAAKVLKSREE